MPSDRELEAKYQEKLYLHGSLSKNQLSAMEVWWEQDQDYVVPTEKALEILQGTLASLVTSREYIEYKPILRGFRCTPFGWYVKKKWDEANVWKVKASVRFAASIGDHYSSLNHEYRKRRRRTGPASVTPIERARRGAA